MGTEHDLPDLPTDLFLMITHHLDPIDIVRCRSVSQSWHRTFTNEPFLRDVLIREYDKAQDVHALLDLEIRHMADRSSGDEFSQCPVVWRRAFDRILARRIALKSGRPRSVTKLDLRVGFTGLSEIKAALRSHFIPVFPWSRYHRSDRPDMQLEEQVPTDLLETNWTYDSGLLVYPDMIKVQAYVLLDIEQDTISIVPFDLTDRIVRRIRLKHKILVFEWAEKEPYHKLNELEEVHRHHVTAFDVELAKDSFPWLSPWRITFRSEWKLHYLGFPLSALDCWFSDHSTTHYVVYIWQTNRSAWGENEPLESLLIWDISKPSSYHLSDELSSGTQASVGPRLVKKLSYLDLDFLTIRQRDTPFLRKITLDGSACVYFFEEGCTRERGSHIGHGYEAGRRNPKDVAWERIVGIPVLGPGPRWEDRLAIDSRFTHEWQPTGSKSPDPLIPKRATCWRYDGMGPGFRSLVVRDVSAGIMFSVVQRTIGFPEIWVSSDSHSWSTEIDLHDIRWRWKQIDGDEHYLIIQSNEELHVLHFDHVPGAKRQKRRSYLGTAC